MNKIDEFLLNFQAKNTKDVYKSHLTKFFNIINANADNYFTKQKTDKDYENDLRTFWQSLNGRPPLTIRNAVSAVKSFYLHNDIELKTKFWKEISKRTKGNRATMIDIVPTNIQLKQILTHADALSSSLFLVLSSSGMRIGEVCQITVNDVNLNLNPVKITVQGDYTKTGNSRIVFISNEAKTALEQWLNIRQDYLSNIAKHAKERFTHYEISTDDNRVYPFNTAAARVRWNDLIKKSGYDEKDPKTKRFKMHIHCLRKYYRSRMSLEIPVDVVEALMGHEGYLTEAYRRYSQEQLAELYVKGMSTITVFESQPDLSGVHEELKKKDKQISDLEKKVEDVDDMKMQLLELRLTIQELKNGKN